MSIIGRSCHVNECVQKGYFLRYRPVATFSDVQHVTWYFKLSVNKYVRGVRLSHTSLSMCVVICDNDDTIHHSIRTLIAAMRAFNSNRAASRRAHKI